MTLQEMVEEARRLSDLLEKGLKVYREAGEDRAEKERRYRKAKAEAWVQVEGTAAHREAQVDALTADLRYERDIAEGLHRAAWEAIRSRSQQISLLQSLLAAHRAEAEFAKFGPEVGR